MKIFSHRYVRLAWRSGRLVLSIAAAILAVVVVATLTVDLGPAVKDYAERAGSKQIERPIHIGRLSIHLLTGRVVVEDFSIGGLHTDDRPFFTAKRLSVSLDWATVVRRRPEILITSVEMSDWQMLVERWETAHNFPKFTRDTPPDAGPRRFTTTLRYLRASNGQFTFEDHEAPWSIVCQNLDLNITNVPNYHGEATFNKGLVTIQHYEPMWAKMRASFELDGPRVHLSRIDLDTDGATTVATGDVDLAHWPEQKYDVKSHVDFPRMRQIFFGAETWDVDGEGDFTGTFQMFKGGRDLSGRFQSAVAGLMAGGTRYEFPRLAGALSWTPTAFDVSDAESAFGGGAAHFSYSIRPLGQGRRPDARFDVAWADVDLAAFTDLERFRGLRFAGSATGRTLLEWPLGRFSDHRGDGVILVAPPPGIQPMAGGLPPERENTDYEWGPFVPLPLAGHLPIGGELTYRFGPDEVTFENGRFATEKTNVAFQGSTAWGDRSQIAFHVTSADWQESQLVLAGIMTDFGSPTGPVAFGGRGEFDGTMTGAFRRPRIEGTFTGERLRAWDTNWGTGSGRIVVENSYVTVADSIVRSGQGELRSDGRFSLGFPRDDGGEEIDARFRVTRWDLESLRHAFGIDDYPVTGLLSGEFHLTGEYQRPLGFGAMTIDSGVAYGEPFDGASASLRFDGRGVRLDGVEIRKGGGGITGAAFVGWDSTYSFNADARRIPVESLRLLAYPTAPLTGVAEFTADGSGTFDSPRYDVRFRVNDLFVADEGVGQVTGTLALRGKELSGEVDAASPRLAVTGAGRIALTPQADAEITFRFHDSSLDPYVRLFVPKLSPFTTAIASGSIRVVGELADVDHLLVDATVDSVDMKLFDYAVHNAGPIHMALDQHQLNIEELEIVGDDTRLRVGGTVGLHENRVALQATGEANLGILQGFFRDVRGSGKADLMAAINGPLDQPVFSGAATIANGRIRHFSLPNSLDSINGTIRFDARGIQLDDVSATMGGGRVQFGGRIGLDGYAPGDLNVTVRGTAMNLRYPEGVRSVVDADLTLRGTPRAPSLGGTVNVRSAVWTRRIDAPGSIFDLARLRSAPAGTPEPAAAAIPLRFDLQIAVPATLRIENNLMRMVASADLNLRGTYDRPVIFGHAEIDRGEVTFEGRRYRVTRGAIDFTNPTRIEPFFDVEAETNVRVPGQTYRVTVSAAGTMDRLQPSLSSDPPLSQTDVLALLFGDSRSQQTLGNAELQALRNPTERQTDILAARATQALTSPISEEVGKVVQQTFGVDTFQLSPSLIDPLSQQTGRVNPTARLTIGKRISDRAYLTFSRSLNSAVYDQIILLEYDASDRLSWILSRNEDQTYALEFRVRHSF